MVLTFNYSSVFDKDVLKRNDLYLTFLYILKRFLNLIKAVLISFQIARVNYKI